MSGSRVDPQDAMTEPDERLLAVMDAIGHYYCDDCWYSCPKAPEGCCDENAGPECRCGLEQKARAVLEIAVAARSAVVRPTRDHVERIVQAARHEYYNGPGRVIVVSEDAAIADALLAEFWPGTPEAADEGDALSVLTRHEFNRLRPAGSPEEGP